MLWKSGMVGLEGVITLQDTIGRLFKLASVANRKVGGWGTPWKNLIHMGPILSMGVVYLPT